MLRLFVGNIPHAYGETELRDWFEAQGHSVGEVQVMRDRITGHSRGFAFIEIHDTSDLKGTVEQLHGRNLAGRALTVNQANPRTSRGGAQSIPA